MTETVQVVAETADGHRHAASSGPTSSTRRSRALATPRTLQGIASSSPAVNENSPNTGQMVINGALRLRQRLHGERRRRQRQPVRAPAEPVHRGRDPGDAGADLGHLGRVRPVLRRRRQRDHQERRQHVLGQLRTNFPNPSWTAETPFEKSKASSIRAQLSARPRGTFGGPILRTPVVLHGRPATPALDAGDVSSRPAFRACETTRTSAARSS